MKPSQDKSKRVRLFKKMAHKLIKLAIRFTRKERKK